MGGGLITEPWETKRVGGDGVVGEGKSESGRWGMERGGRRGVSRAP